MPRPAGNSASVVNVRADHRCERAPGGASFGAVSNQLRVTLEIDAVGEPPQGRMLIAGQPDREFDGYVQLISTLQAARGVCQAAGEGDDRSGR